MRSFGVIILNKHPQFAVKLLESIAHNYKEFLHPLIVIVRDGHREEFGICGEVYADASQPFIYAKNVNLGISAIPSDYDVILLNDDTEIVEENFFHKLQHRVIRYDKCGLMSPMIDGGVGNAYQSWSMRRELWRKYPPEIGIQGVNPVCFPCVYIRRELIDSIGLLDERFTGYGFDDNDYCLRAREAGWMTMITSIYRIKHGSGGGILDRGKNWSCSFVLEEDRPSNEMIFLQKYPQLKRVS
jgi:hypothetical protein